MNTSSRLRHSFYLLNLGDGNPVMIFHYLKINLKLQRSFRIGFNVLKFAESLRGNRLLLTAKFPEIPGIHLIKLGLMNSQVDLEASRWF